MWDDFGGAITWLLKETGPTLAVLGVLGFVFQEKWKQLLSRSLSAELERLKHELTLEQQAHAASLAPQLETIKHDFQKDLEAYKTSLIAQAEEVKLKTDLKKSLGTRYLEIKFGRLMALEEAVANCGTTIQYLIAYQAAARQVQQVSQAVNLLTVYAEAVAKAEMFLDAGERQMLANLRASMAGLLPSIGPGPQPIPFNSPQGQALMQQRIAAEQTIRQKIHELAGI